MEQKYSFTDNGSYLVAANALEIVTAMRDSSRFASDETIWEFMENFSERYQIDTNNLIRTNTVEVFVEDLLHFGFIELVS